MQIYLNKVSAQKEIDKIKTKYKDDVLRILMKNRIMFHKDLAGALGVSPSGLNAIIKQMNASSVKLINTDNASKFKLYSLTPVAYQYCSKMNTERIISPRNSCRHTLFIESHRIKEDSFEINTMCTKRNPTKDSQYKYTVLRASEYSNNDIYFGERQKQSYNFTFI